MVAQYWRPGVELFLLGHPPVHLLLKTSVNVVNYIKNQSQISIAKEKAREKWEEVDILEGRKKMFTIARQMKENQVV